MHKLGSWLILFSCCTCVHAYVRDHVLDVS